MTKTEALELCERGWLELAETGANEKPGMFNWLESNCPCCEYAFSDDAGDHPCVNCPIPADRWGTQDKRFSDDFEGCTYLDSPFMLWWNAETPAERKIHALAVAKLARAELDKETAEDR